jgi:cytoskeletal protein RodZ
MKNTLSKRISALAVAIFIMSAPMTPAMNAVVADRNPGRTDILHLSTSTQETIVLAENEENTTEDKNHTTSGAQDRTPEPGTALETDSSEPSAKSRAAPLKPFVPSEKIPAEQAVDFPVDI